MSNGFDPLREVLHLSEKEKKALETAASIIGQISSVWGYVNTAKSVLTALGVLSEADQVAEMRKRIDDLYRDFHGVVAALDEHDTMRDVANQLALARTALQELTEFAPDDAATLGIDPQWDGFRALVVDHSGLAVNALGSEPYWQRVFVPELSYNWPAGETHPGHPVVTGSGLVFDYRLALPAYLEAITIRVTILTAAVKDYRQHAQGELKHIVTTLEGYFNLIRAAIFNLSWSPSDIYGDVPSWLETGAQIGWMENYSAYDRVEPWPTKEFPRANLSRPVSAEQWSQFEARYAVRSWVRWKQLYADIGLHATEQIIVKLKIMAGIEPASVSGPVGHCSVVELAQALQDFRSVGASWPPAVGYFPLARPISIRKILGLLHATSLREALAV